MNKILDFLINFLRWPVACYFLISIPALLLSFNYFNYHSLKVYALGAGMFFYVATIIFAGYNNCQSMQIISHELTHTFFALLTLHCAGRIRLNPDGSGGSMRLLGGGNWLITLSPYFFPLFVFMYMLIMPFLLTITAHHWLVYSIFGYFFAYYWATVISQVHPQQTDILREGYLFSSIIIIGANLYITGIILAFNSQQWLGIEKYLKLVHHLNLQQWQKAYDLLLTYI